MLEWPLRCHPQITSESRGGRATATPTTVACAQAGQAELRPGDRVRLRPSVRADVFDLALAGQVATIDSIEQDFEDQLYVAVTLDEDPGSDLGALHQIGHRFFFHINEVEPLKQ
jgi:hypothetical protein